jgi:antitoxin (DNA-binding transcriptional repressor) of toxin-antitoxin stability system
MKTLTVEQAASDLEQWLDQALAGEDIRIRKGEALVELRPVGSHPTSAPSEQISPREALRCLQREARLTPEQAQRYLAEIEAERLAVEDRSR